MTNLSCNAAAVFNDMSARSINDKKKEKRKKEKKVRGNMTRIHRNSMSFA